MFTHARTAPRRAAAWLRSLTLASCAPWAVAEQFSGSALRGLHRLNVALEGIAPDFARYGLVAVEMPQHVQ